MTNAIITKKSETFTDFFENFKEVPHLLKKPYSEKEIVSINFLNRTYHASGILELIKVNPTEDEIIIANFMQDMFKDYHKEREPSFDHWSDDYDIRKILVYLFPRRTKKTENIIDLYYKLFSMFIVKDEDIPVLKYKLLNECCFYDYKHEHDAFYTKIAQIKIKKDKTPYKVYFLKCNLSGKIKIGRTKGKRSDRIQALSGASPGGLTLLGIIEKDIENELHKKFAKHRLNGEWFEPVEEILDYINQHSLLV
jgi:hypothetical protein